MESANKEKLPSVMCMQTLHQNVTNALKTISLLMLKMEFNIVFLWQKVNTV